MLRIFLRQFENVRPYWVVTTAVGVVALVLARNLDGFAEWYATHIYTVFPHIIGRFMSIFPFSVFEIGLYVLVIALLAFIIYLSVSAIVPKWRDNVKPVAKRGGSIAVTILCTMFMMFSLAAGVNYSRDTFAELTERELPVEVEREDLLELAELLIEKAAELAMEIPIDERGHFTLREIDLHAETREAMNRLGTRIPELAGFYPNPKPVLASRGMSWLNITGIFSPFTLEANYNRDIPDFLIPFTIFHEFAHVRGIMREDEANFIAYLAGRDAESVELRYSVTVSALLHVLRAHSQAAGRLRHNELLATIPEQVTRDLAANNAYWAQFRGRAAEISTAANNIYLRANAQEDGVMSYGRMVDLLIMEYRIGVERRAREEIYRQMQYQMYYEYESYY